VRVKAVAVRLGVSSPTIRNWSNEFGDFLSPGARPPKGQAREYGEADLETLAAIRHYKMTERLTYEQVRVKLEAGEHERADIPVPEAPAPEPAATALVPVSLVQALYREIGRLQEKLLEGERERGRLEGRLSELERREAPWWRRLFRG
jgi:DNA-binding transcriptional MerR regulator